MRIRVPASIANLGPGFDVLAMAVDLWLEVEAEPADAPDWTFEGEGASWLAGTPHPFAEIPMRGVVRNAVPVGVGLGSSAAARVAAHALRGEDPESAYLAASLAEGHLDNAAAAALGGVVLLVDGVAHRLTAPDLEVAILVSDERVPTEDARALLEPAVSRPDAVFNIAHAALLVHALDAGDWSLLDVAMEDRLHQPARAALYPWLDDVIAIAKVYGAYGAALAGAGPSVMAFAPNGQGERVAEAMAQTANGRGRALVIRPTDSGLQVLP